MKNWAEDVVSYTARLTGYELKTLRRLVNESIYMNEENDEIAHLFGVAVCSTSENLVRILDIEVQLAKIASEDPAYCDRYNESAERVAEWLENIKCWLEIFMDVFDEWEKQDPRERIADLSYLQLTTGDIIGLWNRVLDE